MNILFVLIPLSLLLVVIAVAAFFWAVGDGQFDDLESPGWRVLEDEDEGDAEPSSCGSDFSREHRDAEHPSHGTDHDR